MPNFRYKAMTQAGEIVTGSIAAPTAAEVARRIEYLGLWAGKVRQRLNDLKPPAPVPEVAKGANP